MSKTIDSQSGGRFAVGRFAVGVPFGFIEIVERSDTYASASFRSVTDDVCIRDEIVLFVKVTALRLLIVAPPARAL